MTCETANSSPSTVSTLQVHQLSLWANLGVCASVSLLTGFQLIHSQSLSCVMCLCRWTRRMRAHSNKIKWNYTGLGWREGFLASDATTGSMIKVDTERIIFPFPLIYEPREQHSSTNLPRAYTCPSSRQIFGRQVTKACAKSKQLYTRTWSKLMHLKVTFLPKVLPVERRWRELF